MATKKAASKGAKKSGAAKKGSASKKGGAAKKGASKKAAAKKIGIPAPVNQGKCKDWQAVLDSQPPRAPRLRVTGKCTFPTSGYKVTLKEAVPQGINPNILLLRKTVTPPKGIVLPVLQTIPVSFEKKNVKRKYTHVTILPEVTTIKVKHVT